jgi:hypothetical protein
MSQTRQASAATRRPPLRVRSPIKTVGGRPPPTTSSPPPLSAAAVSAAAAAMHCQVISGSTSLQVTSRAAENPHRTHQLNSDFGEAQEVEFEALRLHRVLSSAEVSALSDAFYRNFGAHVTPATLPQFLTSVGVQYEGPSLLHHPHPSTRSSGDGRTGNDSAAAAAAAAAGAGVAGDGGRTLLRDVILKSVDLEVAFRLAKSTALSRSNINSSKPDNSAPPAAHSHGALLHKALVRVLSARRLSSAASPGGRLLSARGSLLNTPKTSHLPAALHRHHSNAPDGAAAAPPPRTLPPTISFDLMCWIARVLKDLAHARAVASHASTGSSAELLEAYRSCSDEATGAVTVQSIKDRCGLFDVQLSFESKGDAKKKKQKMKKKRQTLFLSAQRQRQRTVEAIDATIDDDSDTLLDKFDDDSDESEGEAARRANSVLDPAQFAKLLRTKQQSNPHRGVSGVAFLSPSNQSKMGGSPNSSSSSSSSSSRSSSPSVNDPMTLPTPHSSSVAQSPSNGTGRHHRLLQLLSNTSPIVSNSARDHVVHSAGSVRRYLSPKRFVAVPYTEDELQLFEGSDQVVATPQTSEEQTMLANTLLGTATCVRPSSLLRKQLCEQQQRCQSAPPLSSLTRAPQNLNGVVSTVTSLLSAHQRAQQPTAGGGGNVVTLKGGASAAVVLQDADQSDVASLLAGGSTAGGGGVGEVDANYRSIISPSESGAMPPPPSLMATYFLPHTAKAHHHHHHHHALKSQPIPSDRDHQHRHVESDDGRWPQNAARRDGSQGVAHMSLGTMNNFDWWPANANSNPPAAQRPITSGNSATSPPHQSHVEQMLEAQDTAMRLHPARAALLGHYYHDIAREKLASAHALAAEYHEQQHHRASRQLDDDVTYSPSHFHRPHQHDSPAVPATMLAASVNVGQRLDAEFPLRGMTWSTASAHFSNLSHPRNAAGESGTDVLRRLTKQHSEQPAIALYRLQQQLALLEASKVSYDEHHNAQTQSRTVEHAGGGLTSAQRLHRFRNSAAAATSPGGKPHATGTHHNAPKKHQVRPATAQ